jgi:F0F1-type ATP synthase membrane subunit b/b'
MTDNWVYGSLILIGLMEVLVVVLLVAFMRLFGKYAELNRKVTERDGKAREAADGLVVEAQARAKAVLADAHAEAERVLKETSTLSEETKAKLEAAAKQALEAQTGAVTGLIKEWQAGFGEAMTTQAEQATLAVTQELSRLAGELRQEMEAVPAELTKVMADARTRAEAEIAGYKEKRMKYVDVNIQVLLQQVASHVLPEAIDFKQHEELILKSLKEAKEQGLF